jgi:hypothetical protein
MYVAEETQISDSHFDLLAEHGETIALVGAINHDYNLVSSVSQFCEYEGTFAVQMGSPNTRMGRLDTHAFMLDYYGDAPTVVRKQLETVIETQENSTDESRFSWELFQGTEDVQNDEKLAETLSRVVGPERLEPEFDVPDDTSVVTLNLGAEGVEMLKEVIDYRVGLPVRIEQHRGETYLIGLTEEYARDTANGLHELEREYSQGGLYESAEIADRLESQLLSVETEASV